MVEFTSALALWHSFGHAFGLSASVVNSILEKHSFGQKLISPVVAAPEPNKNSALENHLHVNTCDNSVRKCQLVSENVMSSRIGRNPFKQKTHHTHTNRYNNRFPAQHNVKKGRITSKNLIAPDRLGRSNKNGCNH